MTTIVEHPIVQELIELVDRRARLQPHLDAYQTLLDLAHVAALSDRDFMRWYTREFEELPPLVRSHVMAFDLRNAFDAKRSRDFAQLRGWILRDLAREALKTARKTGDSDQ